MQVEEMRPLRALQPGEVAWIAALPCALVMLGAIVWLGPVLGHALPGPGSETLWPSGAPYVFGQAEPVKHGRYLLALLAPLPLAAAVFAGSMRRIALRPAAIRALVLTSQMLMAAFLVATVLGQHTIVFPGETEPSPIFTVGTMLIAAVLVLLLLTAMRQPRIASRISRSTRDTRPLRIACLVVAGLVAAMWLMTAVDTDRSGDANALFWMMDDPFAILDGRTPLVDYHALYAQLVPYLSAGVLSLSGGTTLAYTILMTSMSLLALLAVYAIFRRVVHSSLLALALYLPLLAAGFLLAPFPGGAQASNVRLYAMWPMRYGGAYLLAWLTARHLDGAAPRRVWLLSLVAGLVVIDDLEFGLAACAATVVALLCSRPQWSRRSLARLLAGVASGLFGAVLLAALITLLRTGELPHLGLLLEAPRIFGVVGYTAAPMPTLGLQLALYVTFIAAIGTAAVRYVRRDAEPLLTGMLAWSGVFGLLAGSYFVGRSDVLKLVSLFSAWFFALGLLAVVLVRELAARGWRRPRLPEVAVLFALGLAICSFDELPMPWSQVARLRSPTASVNNQPAAERFVAEHTSKHERVAILIGFGHRSAYRAGIVNVAPYSFVEAMVVRSQWVMLLDAMRHEHAHKLFLPNQLMAPAQLDLLARAGFSRQADSGLFSLWSDAPVARA